MPLLLMLLAAGSFGLFAGSQVDDAVDNATTPVGGGVSGKGLPIYVTIPLIVAGGTAAFFLAKKLMKKL